MGGVGLKPCCVLVVSSNEVVCVLALAQEFSLSQQILVLVCVVTPAKSVRVVCGNAHPASIVCARSFIMEAAQIGLVWRITRRSLTDRCAQ